MEEQEQKLLISYVWKDYIRLKRLERSIPRADRAVYDPDGPELIIPDEEQVDNREGDDDQDGEVEDSDDQDDSYDPIRGICSRPVTIRPNGRVDLNHDPYCLKSYFQQHWTYVQDPESMSIPTGRTTSWRSDYFYRESGSSDLEAFDPSQMIQIEFHKRIWLRTCITAHLLFSRVMAVFANPKFMPRDPYKQCWEITLRAKGDEHGYLTLRDFRACPEASYYGSEKYSIVALQLVDWLIGDNVPHPYDYVLCGRAS